MRAGVYARKFAVAMMHVVINRSGRRPTDSGGRRAMMPYAKANAKNGAIALHRIYIL